MAVAGSLLGVNRRLVTKAVQKNFAVNTKFVGADPSGGSRTSILPPGFRFPEALPPGFVNPVQRRTRATVPLSFPSGGPRARSVPLPGPSRTTVGLPPLTFDPGTFTSGLDPRGVDPGACELLSGNAKALCLFVTGLSPGGGPAMPQRPGTDPVVATDPITTGTGTTTGAFGLPAAFPAGVARTVLNCGPRMVLGIDNLCYPKAVLPPRSKFRKWRRPPRVPVTRRDVVAIRRAAAARERVAELAKDVGLKPMVRRKKK